MHSAHDPSRFTLRSYLSADGLRLPAGLLVSAEVSLVTSFTKAVYVSLSALALPVPVGALYVSEIRIEPPSRALEVCTSSHTVLGTIHGATAHCTSLNRGSSVSTSGFSRFAARL